MQSMITLTREKITETTDAFYQGKSREGYTLMNECITCFMGLNQMITEAKGKGELANYQPEQFMNILTEALNAMVAQDAVLLSDILQYDMLEELETLEGSL